jgi:amino acid adenylation domain-containing protein
VNAQLEFTSQDRGNPPGGFGSSPVRLDALFCEQVRRTPDAPAIIRRGEVISYAALDRRSNSFANALIGAGLQRGDRVAIAMPRSIDLIAAMIGALKSGCVYVPIDIAQPEDRAAFMLKDSAAQVLIASDPAIVPTGFTGTRLDPSAIREHEEAPGLRTEQDDPAYIFYTSGSTGRPKGVLLGHNASFYILGSIRHFRDGELDRVAAVTSVSFDPSVFEIFAPLACGGAVVLKDDALEQFTADEHPTLLQGVPTALRQLARAGAIPDTVKAINSGGEVLTRDIADEIFAACRASRIYNHYGPTEASICTTVATIERGSTQSPDLGVPVAGAQLHIRDMASGEPVGEGEAGEICIGGPVLAHGYVGDKVKTDARFVFDRFSHSRVYRTGDLGRIAASGRLEFLGRIDDQVKLRGHRVELAEVDDAIAAMDGIADAGSVIQTVEDGDLRLIAFARADGKAPDDAIVLAALRRRLPVSMLPHRIVWVDAIPRLPNGKIDRAALRLLGTEQPHDSTGQDAETAASPAHAGDARVAETIARLFGDALSRAPFAKDEDFFAAGGDSLMCVDIALELEDILDRPIPVNLLTHHSTPAALATALSHERHRDVPITREGNPDGEAIFIAPGIRGTDTDYDSLKFLIAHRRLIMLHSLPQAAAMIRTPRIETLVDVLVPLIEDEQPEGEVTLLGYSFGGVMAYALARELERRGRKTRLVVIDAQIAHCSASPAQWFAWLRDEFWQSLRTNGLDHAARRLARSLCFWFPKTLGRFRPKYIPEFITSENPQFVGSLVQAATALRYTRRTAPTLLMAAEKMHPTDLLNNPDRLSGWSSVLIGPQITVRRLNVTHAELVRRPVVNRVSAIMEDWLAGPAADQSQA